MQPKNAYLHNFAEQLRALMRENQLTQATLSERCGVSQSSISRYLNGVTEPKISDCISVAEHFEVSLDWLFGLGLEGLKNPRILGKKAYLKDLKKQVTEAKLSLNEALKEISRSLAEQEAEEDEDVFAQIDGVNISSEVKAAAAELIDNVETSTEQDSPSPSHSRKAGGIAGGKPSSSSRGNQPSGSKPRPTRSSSSAPRRKR